MFCYILFLSSAQSLFKRNNDKIRRLSGQLDTALLKYNTQIALLDPTHHAALGCPAGVTRDSVLGEDGDDGFSGMLAADPVHETEATLADKRIVSRLGRRALKLLFRLRAIHFGPEHVLGDLNLLVESWNTEYCLLIEYHAIAKSRADIVYGASIADKNFEMVDRKCMQECIRYSGMTSQLQEQIRWARSMRDIAMVRRGVVEREVSAWKMKHPHPLSKYLGHRVPEVEAVGNVPDDI